MTVPNSRPERRIVTICGSTRFRGEMADANRRLTLAGFIVLAPGVFGHDGDPMTDAEKMALDALHFCKIDLSWGIYVVNPGGYVGESTAREIASSTRASRAGSKPRASGFASGRAARAVEVRTRTRVRRIAREILIPTLPSIPMPSGPRR